MLVYAKIPLRSPSLFIKMLHTKYSLQIEDRHPGTFLHRFRGGLVAAQPLFPPGESYVCGPWPLALAPQGLTIGGVQRLGPPEGYALSPTFVPYEDLAITWEGAS